LMREYLIYQQGRTLGHAARATTGTKPTTLTLSEESVRSLLSRFS
jgi:hypothetical protein